MSPLTGASESELMTVAAFIARLEQERDAIDEAIRLMRTVARLLDTRAPAALVPKPPPPSRDSKFDWARARVLYENDALPVSEIARLLGCSATAVHYRRDREKWITPPAGYVGNGNGAK